jgi:HAD superfamily hydrolase (TIGR01484 family)
VAGDEIANLSEYLSFSVYSGSTRAVPAAIIFPMPNTSMLVSDLDGTLATSEGKFSSATLGTLEDLGQRGVVRAVATGRSLHSARQILPESFPIDYLIFSTGAGVVNWRTGELLVSHCLAEKEVGVLSELLGELNFDFMIHEPVPENHKFRYHRTDSPRPDFLRRLEKQAAFATAFQFSDEPRVASQFLTVCEASESEEISAQVRAWGGPLHVCRTTSPLDGESVWLEILDARASKSQGAAWLADREGVDRAQVFAIGNDYNDLDLLEWAGRSSVVGNAPELLRGRFDRVATNDRDGFTAGVSAWLKGS